MAHPVGQRDGDWLLFDVPAPHFAVGLPDGAVIERLLERTALLPAPCKFALVGAGDLRLRAEQPDVAELDVAIRAAEFAASLAIANGEESVGVAEPIDASTPEVAELCREAGWAFERRSNGALVVDLGVVGSYVSATLEGRGGAIVVEASLVRSVPDSGPCRAALAALLLRANGAFRMVRAVLRSAEGDRQAAFEASLPARASARAVGLALGAVAVAARHCAVEAQRLATDEWIARAYLARVPRVARRAATLASRELDPGSGLVSSQP